jgi:glycosyltransferase involved in cell wall biosynthesis
MPSMTKPKETALTPNAVAAGAATPRHFQPDASRISRAADIHLGAVPPLAERRSADPSVSVVIPALNEAGNIIPVIQGLPGCVTEIIVVDGRSTDDTVQVALAADPRVRVVMERRKGKGVAMLSGFACARGDVIVAIDADGSMDPGEVAVFQATLALGYDLVKGSREAVGGGSEDFSPIRRVGNWALTRLANRLHGTRWSDMCYGYFGFWRDVLPTLDLRWSELTTRALAQRLEAEAGETVGADRLPYGSGFEIETVLFLRAARSGLRIAEVPSREYPRHLGESNLRTVRDGTRVLAAIARERMRRVPAPVAPTVGCGTARIAWSRS